MDTLAMSEMSVKKAAGGGRDDDGHVPLEVRAGRGLYREQWMAVGRGLLLGRHDGLQKHKEERVRLKSLRRVPSASSKPVSWKRTATEACKFAPPCSASTIHLHVCALAPPPTHRTPPPPQIIHSVDVSEIQQVYLASSRLDSDAVVAFVRALAAISLVGTLWRPPGLWQGLGSGVWQFHFCLVSRRCPFSILHSTSPLLYRQFAHP
jgi:hypothetical protein